MQNTNESTAGADASVDVSKLYCMLIHADIVY